MIRRFLRLIPYMLLVFGACLIARPAYFYSKGVLAQILLERAWNKYRSSGDIHRAWSWSDTHPVGRLNIPSINLDQIVLSGTHTEALAFGPGHWPESSQPGEIGTVAIAGHRDSYFRKLHKLDLGDVIQLDYRGGQQIFRVVQFIITSPDSFDLMQGSLATRIALITCYPFDYLGPAPQRYIVLGELVE